jgi:hypothetical protein
VDFVCQNFNTGNKKSAGRLSGKLLKNRLVGSLMKQPKFDWIGKYINPAQLFAHP